MLLGERSLVREARGMEADVMHPFYRCIPMKSYIAVVTDGGRRTVRNAERVRLTVQNLMLATLLDPMEADDAIEQGILPYTSLTLALKTMQEAEYGALPKFLVEFGDSLEKWASTSGNVEMDMSALRVWDTSLVEWMERRSKGAPLTRQQRSMMIRAYFDGTLQIKVAPLTRQQLAMMIRAYFDGMLQMADPARERLLWK